MPTACINQADCSVHLRAERLEVYRREEATGKDQLLREIPLRDLDRLILAESVQITSRALAALLRANIPVSLLAWSGRFLGGFLPAHNDHGRARLLQYQRTLDGAFGLSMAGRTVVAKLYNQRRVLQRLDASRNEAGEPEAASKTAAGATPAQESASGDGARPEVQATIAWLDALFASVRASRSVDELRGYEGAATARYFSAWARFLPPAFPFERRSTRPPLNPVNACISFGATLVYAEVASFIHAHGLDPALGLLHATENGRWSLALDLMEPFRPVIIEPLALDLFSHQVLGATHFQPKNGGVYLNEEGRKKFFLQYERRLERQFVSESVGHRTTLRQQLENQVVLYKAALEEPGKFEPFLMN
jgi:CRISPR-associated protein Cas1